ncbi:FAD-binding oxidoreductase [Streptomyces diastatochromogenes]|nr:FAD-binding oxidoreductase [Streptomyces diastatochromogenes]
MLAGAAASEEAGEPAWWDADVVRHERYGEDLAVLTLRPRQPLPYLPGQYVSVSSLRVPRVWRTYSLADAPRPDGTVELHVSRIAGGAMSTALVDETRPGEVLRLSAPAAGSPRGPRRADCAPIYAGARAGPRCGRCSRRPPSASRSSKGGCSWWPARGSTCTDARRRSA